MVRLVFKTSGGCWTALGGFDSHSPPPLSDTGKTRSAGLVAKGFEMIESISEVPKRFLEP